MHATNFQPVIRIPNKAVAISLDLSVLVAALCTCNVTNAGLALEFLILLLESREWTMLEPGVLKGLLKGILQAI